MAMSEAGHQHRFGAADYAVFALLLAACSTIGVYFGLLARSRPRSTEEYLVGGRRMATLPVALSLVSSYISGIMLLGTPTEIYIHGTQYLYVVFGVVLMGLIMAYGYLPVFHDLQLTSTYEYLEMRFGKSARLMGSVLFAIGVITWIPIVIYVPALAFNQVTGVNVHIVTPVVCIVCIFYTCVGGLKAVVWTDVVQTLAMFGSMLLVVAKATADAGGLSVVWRRSWDSGRIETPNLSLDPRERHTLLELVVGGGAFWLQSAAVNQNQVQRYLALPSLQQARRATFVFVVGALFLTLMCGYCGLLLFAAFQDCDPLATKMAAAKDQLLPLLVMRTLGSMPGLPGCFVAGVFSAALSSMSTALNSMAAVALKDFHGALPGGRAVSARRAGWLMRGVVVAVGALCVGLVFLVERLGAVLQLRISLAAITEGPSLGIFTMGLFLPWVNTKGMLAGSCTGLAFMAWLVWGAHSAAASGAIVHPTKPLSTEGCGYELPTLPPGLSTTRSAPSTAEVMPLYRISYLWYTFVGCLVTVAVALPVSFATRANRAGDVDRRLLSPLVRRFLRGSAPPTHEVEMKSMKLSVLKEEETAAMLKTKE